MPTKRLVKYQLKTTIYQGGLYHEQPIKMYKQPKNNEFMRIDVALTDLQWLLFLCDHFAKMIAGILMLLWSWIRTVIQPLKHLTGRVNKVYKLNKKNYWNGSSFSERLNFSFGQGILNPKNNKKNVLTFPSKY